MHEWIIAPYKQEREAARQQTGADTYQIDCHQNHRGPYTGASELLQALVPVAYQRRPHLVLTHAITILSVAPELMSVIPLSDELNRSFTGATREDGFYSRLRTLHLAHGIGDFLLAYTAQEARHPWSIILENMHLADTLDQEFVAILLRRADPAHLLLSIGTDAGPLPEPLQSALHTYARVVQLQPPTQSEQQKQLANWQLPALWSDWLLQQGEGWSSQRQVWQRLQQRLDLSTYKPEGVSETTVLSQLVRQLPPAQIYQMAQVYVEANGTSEDALARTAYQQLEPALRQQLHQEQAQILENSDHWSLQLGAIPYHYERSHPQVHVGRGIQTLLSACEACLVLGFYEAALDLGRRGRAGIDWQAQPEPYRLFTRGMLVSLLLLGRFTEFETLCQEMLARASDPSLLSSCAYLMAILYARFQAEDKRDYQLARTWIQVAIEHTQALPESEFKISTLTFLAKNTWALTEMRLGQPYKALQLLSEGLARLQAETSEHRRYLRDIEILLQNRAQVYASTGQLEQALQDYGTLIDLGTFGHEYYFNRGNIQRRLGRNQEALEDFENAIRWSPPYPEAYYNRASMLLLLGQHERALADYTIVLDLHPDFVDALINRANLLYDCAAYAEARQDVERGLVLKPNNPHLLSLLGLLEIASQHPQPAYQAFTRALEQDPTLLAAWINRATLLFEEGQAEAAIEDLTHALRISDDATALYNRASIYQAQQRWQAAIDDYSHLLSLTPGNVSEILEQRDHCSQALQQTAQATPVSQVSQSA